MTKRPLMMPLPLGEVRPDHVYSMPDPDELGPAFTEVYRAHYYGEGAVSRDALARVLMLANGYLWLTSEGPGQTDCLRKLRDIWRARKARAL